MLHPMENVEKQDSTKNFVSTLIPQAETVSWRVHNVTDLLKNKAFTSMTLPLEVGWGAVTLSKWEVSLHSTSTMLQARTRLLSPHGERIAHHLTIWVKRNGHFSLIKNSTEYHTAREASVGWGPSFWKLLPLEDLKDEGCGILDVEEDFIEFIVKLTVFGADTEVSHNY